MDILLINPYNKETTGINETTVEVPVGLLTLSSYLENKGIEVGVLDANVMRLGQSEVMEAIKNSRVKIVGISVNIFSFLQAIRYTEEIKNISKDIIVIWGGPHPTSAYSLCLEKSKADFIVIGEGEITLFESLEHILAGQSFKDIFGIAFRDNGGIKINQARERISDLDTLPISSYHLLPDIRLYKTRSRRKPFMGIVTSRGCPFSCIYCSKDVFKDRITMRSPENIIKEIDLLVNDYHIRQIDILDDNFTMDYQRVNRLFDLILERNYKICFSLQSGVRADKVDEKLMIKMRRAGVFKMALGVETGNELILRQIKKKLDLNKVLEVSQLARKLGMVVIGFFMIGLPGDNKETLQETIDFAIKMNPHIANFMMTIPFYGTALYEKIAKEGRFLLDTKYGISCGFYAAKAYYELGDLSSNLMQQYYKKAYKDFYFRFSKVVDILGSIRTLEELKWVFNTGMSTLFPRQ